MGTSQREEREERDMYLLLILLVSPTYGRPSSDQDAEANIENQLDDILEFNSKTGKLLNNSNLFGKVSESLKNARQNIIDMEADLNSLALKFSELREEKSFFPEFTKAQSSLRQTRQELRELAHRTVTEEENVRSLLDALDNAKSHKPILFKAAIGRMKLLMEETKEKLKAAKNKYVEAQLSYTNLISYVKTQQDVLGIEAERIYAKFEEDKEYTEKVRYNCKIASWFTFGLCSLIHHFENEVPLKESRAELADLQSKSGRLLRKTRILNRDIGDAIDVITEEIDLITEWAASAKAVSKNIELYPEDYLVKYQGIKMVFKSGLVDLKNIAKEFLDKTKQ